MEISSGAYEKLGQFYLGRGYDAAAKKMDDNLILYDSKDLVTHGVVLGMTGSGKTGLCLALLEEAAMDNIPAICIDPKGDISNLLLLFPNLTRGEFKDYVNKDDAAKKEKSVDQFAEDTAAMWKNGLGEWGILPGRIEELQKKVDINIFTPGSNMGIPVSILSSLAAPPPEIREDSELFGERIESTVSSLLSLVGVDADPILSPQAVLLATIFQKEWNAQKDINLADLVGFIQDPLPILNGKGDNEEGKIGVMPLEKFLPRKSREALALKLNNLLASPGFEMWLSGPPLDIAKMLHDDSTNKPRISIFSIAHLSDSERMFFVSLLLNQMLGWMRTQSGTTSLRALLYMDEIFGYLPPSANPPSKRPMMTLLKQGRAFGLGCLLATQNPVDLDYKALSNIGTWFLGRLQTERDKMRVLDGLEGAAGTQNAQFDRASMEKLISGLGNRIFLMNNVHADHPKLFQVRWAMSYLAGPLSREQLKKLMENKRRNFESEAKPIPVVSLSRGTTASITQTPAGDVAQSSNIGNGLPEIFVPAPTTQDISYRPHLLRIGCIQFSGVDEPRIKQLVNPVTASGFDMEKIIPDLPQFKDNDSKPLADAILEPRPESATDPIYYKKLKRDFADWLHDQKVNIIFCPLLNKRSKPDDNELVFRQQLEPLAIKERDSKIEDLQAKASKKISTLESSRQAAEIQLSKQKAESKSALLQAGISLLRNLGGLFTKKPGLGALARSASAIGNKGTSAFKQHQDVNNADAKVDQITAEIEAINADLKANSVKLTETYDFKLIPLQSESIAAKKAEIQTIALLWLPYDSNGNIKL